MFDSKYMKKKKLKGNSGKEKKEKKNQHCCKIIVIHEFVSTGVSCHEGIKKKNSKNLKVNMNSYLTFYYSLLI